MNKNTDTVPAGAAALYADIIAHPAEEWKASGSELPYLEWVEHQKAAKKLEKVFAIKVSVLEYERGECISVAEPVTLKKFISKAAAEKFLKEPEDFA